MSPFTPTGTTPTRSTGDLVAGYTLYEVLRTLVERVGWPTEEEKRVVIESIAEAERVNLFGNMATIIECTHEDVPESTGKCTGCGRQINTNRWRN